MRIYTNKKEDCLIDKSLGYEFVSEIKDADRAVLFLNNMGAVLDFFYVWYYRKPTYLIKDNKDISKFFDETIDLFCLGDFIENADSISDVGERMEKIKNEKTNNGKTYKLL